MGRRKEEERKKMGTATGIEERVEQIFHPLPAFPHFPRGFANRSFVRARLL